MTAEGSLFDDAGDRVTNGPDDEQTAEAAGKLERGTSLARTSDWGRTAKAGEDRRGGLLGSVARYRRGRLVSDTSASEPVRHRWSRWSDRGVTAESGR